MFKRLLLAAPLAMLLSVAPALRAADGGAVPAGAAPAVASPAATSHAPITDLDSDLVYAVLVAEVASQRGDQRMAFTHYLHGARLARDPALAEMAARAALNRDDNEAARRAADLWVDLAPESAKAHQIAAYVYLDAGERTAALAELRRVVELAPDSGDGYLQAVRLLTRLENAADRLAVMQELVATAPDNADAQFALATLAAAAGDNALAQTAATRAAELRDGWNKPRLLLIRVLLSEERRDEALAALDTFLEDAPNDADFSKLRAQFHIDEEQYDEALRLFDRVLDGSPGDGDVLFAAAVLAMQIEAFDKARDYLLQLRGTGNRSGDTAFLLGQVEEASGNLESALSWYDKVSGQNATNAEVRIAGIRAEQGDMERAREIMEQLRVQYPNDATTLYLIEAELLREHDLQEQALQVYSTALGADPANADLLYARAMLAASMDRVDLLEHDLRQILVDDPDHVDALNALGYTLADRTDRLEEAYRFVQRALELRPDEPAILDSMGWVLYRMGEADAAEPYLRKALEQNFDAEIAAHLGEVLWELDRRDEARDVWRRALDEDPEHKYLLRVLGRYRFSHTD